MEIFWKALYKYTISEAKTNRIILQGATRRNEIYENLKSASDKLRKPESLSRKIYRYVVCKVWFCFIAPIWLVKEFFTMMNTSKGYSCIYHMLMALFLIYLIVTNPYESDWFFKVNLLLRKMPQTIRSMINPKCIILEYDTTSYLWQEWLKEKCLKQFINELQINDRGIFESVIKTNAVFEFIFLLCVLPLFSILYSNFGTSSVIMAITVLVAIYFLQDSLVYCTQQSPLWRLILFYIIGISPILVFLYDYEVCLLLQWLMAGAMVLLILGNRILPNNTDSQYQILVDINESLEVLDKICRLHEVIKRESIIFTVVTNDLNIQIPEQYRRYFKFIVKTTNHSESLDIYDQIFDLSEISELTPSQSNSQHTNITYWVDASIQCIRSDAPAFVLDGLKFLSLLIKTDHGVLPDKVILSVVGSQLNRFARKYRRLIMYNEPEFSRVKEFLAYLKNSGIIHDDQEDPQLRDEHPHNYDIELM